jgi:hypothetical protein
MWLIMKGFDRLSACPHGANSRIGIRACSALMLTLAAAGMASAQTTQVPLAKSFTVAPAPAISTTSFVPQIAPPGPGKAIPENPVKKVPQGPANSLTSVGGFLTGNRVATTANFPGMSSTGWEPPDCDIAVGPNHVVQVVNSSIAFFRKIDGGQTFQQDFVNFYKGVGTETDFLFDPKCFYDAVSKRFFVIALEEDDAKKVSKLLISVSDDADPNGNWFRYRIEAKGTFGSDEAWLDYPGFSCNKDAVLVTGNMFGFTSGAYGAVFIVLPKQPLLNNGTVKASTFYDGSAFTAQPSRTSDAVLDRIYTVSSSRSTTQMQIHAIMGLPNSPTVTSTTISIPSFVPPLDYVYGPDGIILDSLDPRTFTSAYRAGSLVAAHNVSVSFSDSRIATRWYEVSTKGWPTTGNQPTLIQSGTLVGGAGESLHMPAINVNKRGAISLLMSRTSPTVMADVMISSRVKSDPLGKMSVPKKLGGSKAKAAYGANRWGDYFSVNIDPNDDSTFWGNGETFGSNGFWSTEIVTWKVNDIDAAAVFNLNPPVVMQGTYQRGNAASLVSVDLNTYNVKTAPMANLGQVATWEATVATNMTPLSVDYLAVRWNLTAPAASTTFIFAYNWSTNQYEAIATKPARSGINESIEVTTNMTKYLRYDGVMKIAMRALTPIRNGIMPTAFSFKVDQLQVLGLNKS